MTLTNLNSSLGRFRNKGIQPEIGWNWTRLKIILEMKKNVITLESKSLNVHLSGSVKIFVRR